MPRGISILELERLISDEDACLDILFTLHYTGKVCPVCNHPKYHRVKGRACYECGKCGRQIYPKINTLMKGGKHSIRLWLYGIHYMITAPSVSAITLGKHLGISERHSWTFMKKMQQLMKEDTSKPFSGIMMIDSTLLDCTMNKAEKNTIEEKRKELKDLKINKTVIFGIREKKSRRIRLFEIERESQKEVLPIIDAHIEKGSMIYSDKGGAFANLSVLGYRHSTVNHSKFEWKRGWTTTSPIEGVWSWMKRSIFGVHVHISKKYMRNYLDEMEFRYNHCNEDIIDTFFILVGRLFDADPEIVKRLFFSRLKSQ